MGLSFFARDRPWTPGLAAWAPILDTLGELGLGNAGKLSALAASLSEAKLMLGKSGAYACHGIHHIKLVLQENRIEQVKAYYFFIVVPRL